MMHLPCISIFSLHDAMLWTLDTVHNVDIFPDHNKRSENPGIHSLSTHNRPVRSVKVVISYKAAQTCYKNHQMIYFSVPKVINGASTVSALYIQLIIDLVQLTVVNVVNLIVLYYTSLRIFQATVNSKKPIALLTLLLHNHFSNIPHLLLSLSA